MKKTYGMGYWLRYYTTDMPKFPMIQFFLKFWYFVQWNDHFQYNKLNKRDRHIFQSHLFKHTIKVELLKFFVAIYIKKTLDIYWKTLKNI